MPRARSRRSSRSRRRPRPRAPAGPRGRPARPGPTSRWRPCRPETATSPRIIRISSSLVTLRLLVQPDDGHDTTLVSGMSRDSSGPSRPSRSSTSRRNVSLARSHSRARSRLGRSAAPGEVQRAGRSPAASARCARRASDPAPAPACNCSGRYDAPRRVQATRSAFGATAAVGSIWSRVSRVPPSPGRWGGPRPAVGLAPRSGVPRCDRVGGPPPGEAHRRRPPGPAGGRRSPRRPGGGSPGRLGRAAGELPAPHLITRHP